MNFFCRRPDPLGLMYGDDVAFEESRKLCQVDVAAKSAFGVCGCLFYVDCHCCFSVSSRAYFSSSSSCRLPPLRVSELCCLSAAVRGRLCCYEGPPWVGAHGGQGPLPQLYLPPVATSRPCCLCCSLCFRRKGRALFGSADRPSLGAFWASQTPRDVVGNAADGDDPWPLIERKK